MGGMSIVTMMGQARPAACAFFKALAESGQSVATEHKTRKMASKVLEYSVIYYWLASSPIGHFHKLGACSENVV
jgi:hypothetical protein